MRQRLPATVGQEVEKSVMWCEMSGLFFGRHWLWKIKIRQMKGRTPGEQAIWFSNRRPCFNNYYILGSSVLNFPHTHTCTYMYTCAFIVHICIRVHLLHVPEVCQIFSSIMSRQHHSLNKFSNGFQSMWKCYTQRYGKWYSHAVGTRSQGFRSFNWCWFVIYKPHFSSVSECG